MMDNAALLSPAEVRVVARYFSEQEAPGSNRKDIEATDRRRRRFVQRRPTGRKILLACAACHVKGDPAANFPAITAQHPGLHREAAARL